MRVAIIFTAMFWLYAGLAQGQISFSEKGLDYFMYQEDWSCGVAIIDLNDDAIDEIVVANNSDRNRLYFRFDTLYTDLALQYGINQTNHHHSITIADIDKDIRPDLYITGDPPYSYEGRYYVNQGEPPFIDRAEEFNLDYVTEMGSAFFQMTPQAGLSGYIGGRLMIREEDTFVDVTEGSGLETITNVHCPLFFDLDGDIDDDLFVAGNHTAQVGRLFRNNGDSTFTDISNNTNQGGFPLCQGAAIGDIDNDGDFDLYLTFATGYNSMWENDGTGFFTNITNHSHTGVAGFTRGVCFGDFDNDTDLDLFLNRAEDYNLLFINNGHGVFTDISVDAGVIDNLNGIGCATGDLDNDGQLDIVAVNCDFQRNLVYINENEDSSFLKVRMFGLPKNSLALGSIINLFGVSEDNLDTVRIGKREVQSHTGMFSVSDPVAHFGIGDYQNLIVKAIFQSLDEVTLYDIWPGQTITIYERPTGIVDNDPSLPDQMTLATYPNPFNSAINIAVTGGTRPGYELAIYDMLGRLVNSDLIYETGDLNYTWDGLNYSGQPAPSGIYCLRVRNGEYAAEKKITLVK